MQRAQQQRVPEDADRRLGDQRGFAGDGAGLGHQQFLGRELVGGEIGGEVEARRGLLQLRQGHLVIGLVGVATVDLGPVDPGDFGFEGHQRGGAGLGIGFSGQGQHLFQMRDIGGADRRHLGVGFQVEVAVRQAQARLVQDQDVGFGILVVLVDVEAEGAVNSRARGFGGEPGIGCLVLDRPDPVDPWPDGGQALLLDGRGVEIAGIGIADLAAGVRLRSFENASGPLARQVVQRVEGAVIGLVRRDGRVLRPCAVGIVVEIVAGLHRLVHAGTVEAIAAIGRFCGGVGLGDGRAAHQRNCRRAEEKISHKSFPLLSGRDACGRPLMAGS